MHLLKYRLTKRQLDVLKNRKELTKGGISRRDLLKLGLMTSAGVLVDGLSVSRAFGQTTTPTAIDSTGAITAVLEARVNPAAPAGPVFAWSARRSSRSWTCCRRRATGPGGS